MLPPPSFTLGYLVRGAVLWFGVHFAAGFAVALDGDGGAAGSTLLLRPLAVLFLLSAVYLASWVDDRARRDLVLLGNLGVPPWWPAAVSTGAALALELCVQAALGSL
jgi:hypothetical protein